MPEKNRKISTRLLHKGALIEETYTAFQHWDLSLPFRENIKHLHRTNPIGAKNEGWLTENLKTISSRFAHDENFESLVALARGRIGFTPWKACYLWHIGNVDELYYRFATEWLFERYQNGVSAVLNSDPLPFVKHITGGKTATGAPLSEYGSKTISSDLLRMAVAFDLMEGRLKRKFRIYHLPRAAFLYVLHGIADQGGNTAQIINSKDWRLFLLAPSDVERELLRLHQYQVLEYEVAGSITALRLPDRSQKEYVRSLLR
jgi:hypothetical protein